MESRTAPMNSILCTGIRVDLDSVLGSAPKSRTGVSQCGIRGTLLSEATEYECLETVPWPGGNSHGFQEVHCMGAGPNGANVWGHNSI